VIAAARVFLGHLFPIWLGFKGGKESPPQAGPPRSRLAGQVSSRRGVARPSPLSFAIRSVAALAACIAAVLARWLLTDPQQAN